MEITKGKWGKITVKPDTNTKLAEANKELLEVCKMGVNVLDKVRYPTEKEIKALVELFNHIIKKHSHA